MIIKKKLQITTNGIISFRVPLRTFTPQPFPNDIVMISPFWADADTRQSSEAPPGSLTYNDIGHIWYRQDFSESLLARAAEQITDAFPSLSTFKPTSLFIVTWDKVGYYSRHIDKVHIIIFIL